MRLNYCGLGTSGSRSRVLVASGMLLTLAALVLSLGARWQTPVVSGARIAPTPFPVSGLKAAAQGMPAIRAGLDRLPLIFEPNQGQTDPTVRFLARGSGYGLFLTSEEAVLVLRARRPQDSRRDAGATNVVRMQLAGANLASAVMGADPLPGHSNYFIGNDPKKWHRNVPQFAQVRYTAVYPGIDLAYYGNGGRLEYDFEVAAGADPKQIALRFQGPEKLTIGPNGDLMLASGDGDVRLQAPRVYQKFGEEQRPIAGRFALLGTDEVGFEIGAYDRSRALVIDPILTYSSYLGGTLGEGCTAITGTTTPGCPAIAVDSAFNIYVAGTTSSTDFPSALGSLTGAANIFVTKFNSSGSAITFSTYLGGTGTDTSAAIAVDAASSVYVTGTTSSGDFPVSANAVQSLPVSVGNHVFASELSLDGTAVLFSTYLSGDGVDTATGLALDFHAKMYVTGTTASSNFPVTPDAFQLTPKATNQFFFSKLDPIGATSTDSLLYSTYVGGATPSTGTVSGGGIAIEPTTGNVFITGGTTFTDMALNSPQAQAGGTDAIVGRFDLSQASGAQEIYLAYVGGTGNDVGNGVAVDTGLNAYIVGTTNSTDVTTITPLPSGTVPFQAANAGANDAFVAKIGSAPATGETTYPLNYFSYLGGTADDTGLAIAVDANQGARLTGTTASSDFHLSPAVGALQSAIGGGVDAFAARIDTTSIDPLATSHFSTFLGGTGNDQGTGIAIDSQGNTFLAGDTASTDFPTASPFQAAISGTSDAFVTKLGPTVSLDMTVAVSPANALGAGEVGVGNQVTFTYTITNNADFASGVTFVDNIATNTTFVSATPTPGCGGVTSGTVLCNLGTLNGGGTATVTIVVTVPAPTLPGSFAISNSASVSANGSTNPVTANASAAVDDYSITPNRSTATVTAGQTASYQVTVAPIPSIGAIPNSISLSCSAGLPAATTCTFTTQLIPNLSTGAASSTLNLATMLRPTTTARLFGSGGPLYATWLPISGLALLGVGIGGKRSRKRQVLLGLVVAGFFALILFQAGCGSSSTTPASTGGTPAGTYNITVTATSGSATRSTTVELVVN